MARAPERDGCIDPPLTTAVQREAVAETPMEQLRAAHRACWASFRLRDWGHRPHAVLLASPGSWVGCTSPKVRASWGPHSVRDVERRRHGCTPCDRILSALPGQYPRPPHLGVKGSQVQILSSRLERVAGQGPFQSNLRRPLDRFWGPLGDPPALTGSASDDDPAGQRPRCAEHAEVGGEGGAGGVDLAHVGVQVPPRGGERSVPGDLAQNVHGDTGVGEPGESRVTEVVGGAGARTRARRRPRPSGWRRAERRWRYDRRVAP